ncbi:MAG: hypothetical protein KF850_30760 [Labilithrix sp.]|nr:hypothetical protein [Labilithrix sp.]MBX3216458.1 hypothetical protein [Labilithrix sp.]
MQKSLGVVLAVLTLFAAGCGSYRVLSEAKTGGTVALEGAHDRARSKAESYMRAQCPGGFEIVEEGDAIASDGASREWRISYVCAGASAPRTALIAL